MRYRMLCTFVLAVGSGVCQGGPEQAFELASIKPSSPLSADLATGMAQLNRTDRTSAGQASFTRVSLKDLIARAYRVEPFRVSGPDWMRTAQFDIVAKIPKGASVDSIPEMLQKLLADRFTLKTHLISREYDVYTLAVGSEGMKVAPKPDEYVADSRSTTLPITMEQFVFRLSQVLERPVVNQTGVEGTYMFPRDFSVGLANRFLWLKTGSQAALERAMEVPSQGDILKAINALGLRLESRKLPLATVVVDRLEKTPTEN